MRPFLHLDIMVSRHIPKECAIYIDCPDMSIHRTREKKENPHYGFLVSWEPGKAGVNRESISTKVKLNSRVGGRKRADILAQASQARTLKKDIIRSLILISLVLILELVVYLAWTFKVLP